MNNDEIHDKNTKKNKQKKNPSELMVRNTPTYGRIEIQTWMHHLAVRTTAGLRHHNENEI